MTEESYQKIINEARKHGGVALRHQYLKVHQNGAKFTINKAYIDDEVLEIDVPYTMILIPEAINKMIFALTHFDRLIGPVMLESFPQEILTKADRNIIAQIMDQYDSTTNTGFIQINNLNCLNKYIEIPNEKVPAGHELFMISVVFPYRPNQDLLNTIGSLLDEFIGEFKDMPLNFDAISRKKDIKESIEMIKETDEMRKKILALLKKTAEKSIKNQD